MPMSYVWRDRARPGDDEAQRQRDAAQPRLGSLVGHAAPQRFGSSPRSRHSGCRAESTPAELEIACRSSPFGIGGPRPPPSGASLDSPRVAPRVYAALVRDFFGIPWSGLTFRGLEAFFAEAGDEGLTWEAKGGDRRPHRDTVRKAVCGFANATGGFLIVGADRGHSGWTVPGVVFDLDEPATWISGVIATGLRPSPSYDVKVFDRAGGRKVAVVAVDALAVPPCVTANGIVYQRVSGQTLPVTDQRVLADLFGRGRAARAEAAVLASRAGLRALDEPATLPPRDSLLSVALCPVQGAADRSRVLFSKSFADALAERVRVDLQVEPVVAYPVRLGLSQDSVSAWPTGHIVTQSWKVAAYWDGSVSAVYATVGTEFDAGEFVLRVSRAWKVLAQVASDLGGGGEAHLVVTAKDDHPAVVGKRHRPRRATQRWTEVHAPTDAELGAVEREFRRSFGDIVWEPEDLAQSSREHDA
jgi:hypothetical protein